MTVTVSRVRRSGTRLLAGAPAGSRTVTVRPGRTRTVVIALHGVHAGLLWIAVHSRDGRPLLQTIVPVRWPRRG